MTVQDCKKNHYRQPVTLTEAERYAQRAFGPGAGYSIEEQ